MPRIRIKEVNDSIGVTNTYDIVNAIRNSNGDEFSRYVPLADATNVAEVGAGILLNKTMQNSFVNALVERIGLVVMRKVSLSNPLKKFKKGQMPFGRTIEEIFTDIAKAEKYDPEDAEKTLFKRTMPNVKVLFHERNRQEFYPATIEDDSLKSAFTSWDKFGDFVSSIYDSMYNGSEVDEYEYMKLLVDNYASKGLFHVVPVAKPDTATNASAFVKKVRAMARKMTIPVGSDKYNALAVRTRSDMSDLHMIIDADLEAEIDVEVLAKAFNMDKADFLGNITVIDGFATTGLEAVLIDQSWFMVYDNELSMESIRNPKGKNWNLFYHVWQTLSVSRFSNAVAFMSGDVPDVTQVIIDPTILAIKPERTHQFIPHIRATDLEPHELTWEITPTAGSTIASGTSINQDGLLTIGATQEGEFTVTATTPNGQMSEDEVPVPLLATGTAIVTVIPK